MQFPAELEELSIHMVHHSTAAIDELVNQVCPRAGACSNQAPHVVQC